MLLQLCTWPEVEEYLKSSTGIILPIGSTEQHGPTGLIGTDAICAEAIAKGVGEETGAMIGPTIAVGMALHHLAFPGSMSLRPSTLIQVVLDSVTSLARAGFTHFYFLNGHGGNIATLKVGNWFMARSVYQLAKQLYGNEEGSHATPSEVALTQFVYPEAIKNVPLSSPVASGHSIYGANAFRQHYPDGRMGSNPALATPEQGKQFYEVAVKEMGESYQAFLKES
jgi:creatinine amidohydrolase